MKKLSLLLLLFCFTARYYGQGSAAYDTIRKNEISVSVLPAIGIFSGYDPAWRYANFTFSYKHYFKDSIVFRSAFSISPEYYLRGGSDGERYVRTIDTMNVFSNYSIRASQRVQLSFGFEKIFRAKRFMHGIGAELRLSSQSYTYNDPVYWYPSRLSSSSAERSNYDPYGTIPGKINNNVDSLSYSYKATDRGIGVQLFYSLRYKINKYFYITSTIGPYFTALYRTYGHQHGAKANSIYGNTIEFDAMILVSDISLAFRF